MSKVKKDWIEEQKRLSFTIEYIHKTLKATEMYRTVYKDNIKDAMVNLDYLDSSQSYISVLVNTKFMEMADRNFDSLMRASVKPYFARIDFRQRGSELLEKIYIGKTSLMKDDDTMPIIVDWRAPIANLYYEGRIGETTYESQGDSYAGEMTLKRQFNIENAELVDYMDIDITTNDAFLQASLESGADQRLKDIANTIQAEQNRVIRYSLRKPLIVQGVAGSGKTTIALHRIAYFIYTYQDLITPDQFMILAPNKMFLNYISEILPELGVEKVRQTTWVDFVHMATGKRFKYTDVTHKLVDKLHRKHSEVFQNEIIEVAGYKGSRDFQVAIDLFLASYKEQFCQSPDFGFSKYKLMEGKDITRLLLKDLQDTPLYLRLKTLQKALQNKVKAAKKDILKSIQEFYDARIDNWQTVLPPSEDRRTKVVALMDERDEKIKAAERELKTLVSRYLKQYEQLDVISIYIKLFQGTWVPEVVGRHSLSVLNQGTVEIEDFAALLYISHQVQGLTGDLDIKCVVIDEAQDFSVFQIAVLKRVLKTNMFTLLGDLSQGIHAYRGIKRWEDLMDSVFDSDHTELLKLEQSYRTTVEIMALANRVIALWEHPDRVLAVPVIRHGQHPHFFIEKSKNDWVEAMVKVVEEVVSKPYKSIAIIAKTDAECQTILKWIADKVPHSITYLSGTQEAYQAGLVILPAYVAKGLEFDVVILAPLTERYSKDELDIKLLYVACTRAMHEMYIVAIENHLPQEVLPYEPN